jgi:hypothetical protein
MQIIQEHINESVPSLHQVQEGLRELKHQNESLEQDMDGHCGFHMMTATLRYLPTRGFNMGTKRHWKRARKMTITPFLTWQPLIIRGVESWDRIRRQQASETSPKRHVCRVRKRPSGVFLKQGQHYIIKQYIKVLHYFGCVFN